ncbi:uncharacterized protein LOC125670973 [Ostrea edulis]|uniref:uncharacterized protein LOC125670973 n=1 Tax=Ostrea edulis TaxID=37623 RepID=UPI0024AF4190|nr:uncharacterized protein LOC125670973 [Ostrea edulis]
MKCTSYIVLTIWYLLFMDTTAEFTEETLRVVLKEVNELRLVVMDLKNLIIQQDERITGLVAAQIQDRDKIKKLESDYRTSRFCGNHSVKAADVPPTNELKVARSSDSILPMVSDADETFKDDDTAQLLTSPKTRQIRGIVAFYAYMSSDLQPGIHHTIPFDVVKTNDGNGYHHSSGVFIAPVSGVYVFTWTIRMTLESEHSTELVVNDVVYGAIFMRTHTPEDQNVSGTVVVHVNQNDDVYIRTHVSYPYNAGNIRSDQYSRTSFAGWKLN